MRVANPVAVLPASVYDALVEILDLLSLGSGVRLVPINDELSAEEASRILGVHVRSALTGGASLCRASRSVLERVLRMPARSAVCSSILELIGATPLVRLSRIAEPNAASLLAKLEHFNPSGSHKDRIAAEMIEHAEVAGHLRSGDTIVEASCGSFAVALALVCRVRGYRFVAVMPDSVTSEQRDLLTAYGAALELTPAAQGIAGALAKAAEIAVEPGAVRLNQYESVQNWQAHQRGEGAELVAQAREYGAPLDAVVMTVGTGGTLRGVEQAVRSHFPASLLVGITIQEEGAAPLALRRSASESFFSGGRQLEISATAAWRMKERLAREEGLLVGITSGANVEGALHIARELGPGKFVYALCCDGGERYFSLEGDLG